MWMGKPSDVHPFDTMKHDETVCLLQRISRCFGSRTPQRLHVHVRHVHVRPRTMDQVGTFCGSVGGVCGWSCGATISAARLPGCGSDNRRSAREKPREDRGEWSGWRVDGDRRGGYTPPLLPQGAFGVRFRDIFGVSSGFRFFSWARC